MTLEPSSSKWLRRVLIADGAMGLAVAAVHLLAGAVLAGWLALPSPLLLGSGVFLIGWGLWLVALGRSPHLGAAAVWTVIGGNVLWALAALALWSGAGGVEGNPWGRAYLLLHALLVLVLADLEWFGLRRARRARGRAEPRPENAQPVLRH